MLCFEPSPPPVESTHEQRAHGGESVAGCDQILNLKLKNNLVV
jgi:hypothetical protein